jgi:hypothetical protein
LVGPATNVFGFAPLLTFMTLYTTPKSWVVILSNWASCRLACFASLCLCDANKVAPSD